MDPKKNDARTAGWLYLMMGITGAFGLMYVPARIVVHGDAAATATNIINSEFLFRLGIAGNLLCQVIFVFLVLALYRLLNGVSKENARLMVALVLVSVPVAFLNMLNQVAALVILKEPVYLQVFEPARLHAFSMFFINLYEQGIAIVEIFWGLWLFPFGLLVYRSGFIPKIFGILLIIACFGYVAGSVSVILFPQIIDPVAIFTSVSGTAGEVSIICWLLIKGVRDQIPSLTGSTG
jgi:hypothetical protein